MGASSMTFTANSFASCLVDGGAVHGVRDGDGDGAAGTDDRVGYKVTFCKSIALPTWSIPSPAKSAGLNDFAYLQ